VSAENFVIGKLRGTKYVAETVGVIIPRHVHTAETNHISVVTQGHFTGRGDWGKTPMPPGVYDWVAGEAHEIIADEIDSVMINLLKGE
jgi:hypothetical protein